VKISRRRPPIWLACLAWAACVVAGWFWIRFLPQAATRPSVGFTAMYTSARLIREGAPLARAYEDDWFHAQIDRFTPGVRDIFRPNPPSAALLALPLASLDYRPARSAWIGLSLLILVLLCIRFRRYLNLQGLATPGLVLFFLAFQPIRRCLWFGQVYIVLLGLLVLAWEGLRRGKGSLGGIPLGLLFGLKSAAMPLWLVFLQRRQRRALIWAVGTLAAIGLLTLPWLKAESWRAYASCLLHWRGLMDRPEQAVTAYQAFPSLFRHLTTFDAQWNPHPWFRLPELGAALTLAAGLGILGVSIYRIHKGPDPSLAVALLTLAGLMLNPWTLDYHYPLLLLPLMILLHAQVYNRVSRGHWWWLGTGTLLVAAPLPYSPAPGLQAGPMALLAYPKLYGALALWMLAVNLSKRPGTPDSVSTATPV
jgi:hypothetical protein